MIYSILISIMWAVNCYSIQTAPNASEIIRKQQAVLDQVIEFLDRIQEKVRHSQDLMEIIKNNTLYINNVSNRYVVQKSIQNRDTVLNGTFNSTKNGRNVLPTNISDEPLKRNKTIIMQALRSIVVNKPNKIKASRTLKRTISTKSRSIRTIESHSQTHHTRTREVTHSNKVKEKIHTRYGVVPDPISDYDVVDVGIPEVMQTVMYISSPKSSTIATTELPPFLFEPQNLIKYESTISTSPVMDVLVPDPVTEYVDIFAEDQATEDSRASMLLRHGYASGTQATQTVTLDRLQSDFQRIATMKDIPLPTQPTQFRAEIYKKMNTENVGYFSAGLWKLLKLIDSKPYRVVKDVFQWLPHVLYRIPFGQFRTSGMMQTIQKAVNGVRFFTFDQIRDYAKHVADMISYRKQRPQKDMNFLYNMFDILLTKEQGEAIIDVLTEFRDYPNHSTKKSGYHLCEAIVDAFILSAISTVSSKSDIELTRLTNVAMGHNRAPPNSYGNYNFRPNFQQPYRNRRLNKKHTSTAHIHLINKQTN